MILPLFGYLLGARLFDFRNTLSIRASGFGLDFGCLVWTYRKALGMQPSGGKRKGCKASWKRCERILHRKGISADVVSSGIVFLLLALECS